MANYGKYYIAERLLILKQYLGANAGKNRIVTRGELEGLLKEHGISVEKKKPSMRTSPLWGTSAAKSISRFWMYRRCRRP